eukprot:11074876-Prorocentrum_lima.AAC.1
MSLPFRPVLYAAPTRQTTETPILKASQTYPAPFGRPMAKLYRKLGGVEEGLKNTLQAMDGVPCPWRAA